jgi:O-antigen/teichoic acid export membrane protein
MYRPLAEKDDGKLAALLQLYRKVYVIIGFVVFGVGLCLIPFMGYLIKDPPDLPPFVITLSATTVEIPQLTLYYVLFLTNSAMSYWFWGYKRSVLSADQKEYMITNYQTILTIVRAVLQIGVLLVLKDFTVYLLLQLGSTVAVNILVARKAGKMYPALKRTDVSPLSDEEKKKISKDVGSLAVTRIGYVALNSTSTILISSMVAFSLVGILSNYNMITEALTGVLTMLTGAITASLGNYFVERSQEESYTLFKNIEFVNSWLYGICSICLVILLNPFITLWIGEEYLLSTPVVVVIVLNFFVSGYVNVLWVFRSSLGLFTQGWFRPLIVAGLNIGFSILLGHFFGLFGILISNFLARALVNVWYDPIVIYKYGFGRSAKPFFISYVWRILQIVLTAGVLAVAKHFLLRDGVTLGRFILLTLLTGVVSVASFWVVNRKRPEMQYFYALTKDKVGLAKDKVVAFLKRNREGKMGQ